MQLADPAWSPYWLNYKLLKKKLKSLPTYGESTGSKAGGDSETDESTTAANVPKEQHVGDATIEEISESSKRPSKRPRKVLEESQAEDNGDLSTPLRRSPEEIDFFKALHAELKKAQFFFDEATKEHRVRLKRMTMGVSVVKLQSRSMMEDKWATMSRAMYLLYKDLLLLETFAIMTYVGFSKILKKHDKVTGFRTCSQYMSNIVGGANFTHYPQVMEMITESQRLYEEISQEMEQEGRQVLSEDEHLFINMISKVNMEAKSGNDERPSSPSEADANGSAAVGDLRELLNADGTENAKSSTDVDEEMKPSPRKSLKSRA